MQTDWRGKYRSVCSVQPNGIRETRVYRFSKNKKVKATMFLLTGNLEIVEEIYNYYCLTKDFDFLKEHIDTVRYGLEFVQKYIDENGRLWGDVYYEDQVMKDGANAQAQAFAVHIFRVMAKLETILNKPNNAKVYFEMSQKLADNYSKPLPDGYWDNEKGRYIDWIDRKGKVHDHVHLLSNALSVTFEISNNKQIDAVNKTISSYDSIFQKFPSFVAAKIEDYTDDEIGTGGPYDLCAAGRYWCHDAKYRKHINARSILKNQLVIVANQARLDDFKMGERYDMNYIYYNTGKDADRNWHGSPLYYEYPNVFADVLIHDYIGIDGDEETDVSLFPCVIDYGTALMESYGVSYEYKENEFSVKNISGKNQSVKINLSKLFDICVHNGKKLTPDTIIDFEAGQKITFQEKIVY